MGKINVDYDVLNQKGSPAWYSDLFANLPTPGYTGRMFISTDTFAFYRDNGTGWDLTGGPGTGTITGSGVSGQVTFFNGTATIGGSTNLVWDNTNNRLGIGVASPTVTLEISGSVKATALIKSGGTSAQILLADGTTTPTSTFQAAITLTTTGTTGSSTLVAGVLNVPTYTFVSSVNAITLGTSGTDLTSSVANSTTTPTITLNVPTASATNRGALSSADWTTFNSKQATITLTTTGTSGAATLVGATLNIPNYTNVGTVTSVAALTLGTSGTDLSSTVANSTSTPVITLNVPTASATNRGALSSADFTTFNNKQATISVTAPVVLTGATISMPAATTSVNGYLTSTDWNTFNNKTSNLGTVTDVVALTIGTTGIDITSTAVTTTTTPVITLNIPTASASNRGALSSTDWTTFNNKQATLSLTTTGTSGVATLVANVLNVPNYGSALSGYLPLSGGTLTGALGGTSASFSSSVTAGSSGQVFVTGNAGTNSIGMQFTNTGGNSFIGLSNSGGTGYLSGSAYAFNIQTEGAQDLQLGTTNLNRLTIKSGGNVGIGTSSPSDYLGSYFGMAMYNSTNSVLSIATGSTGQSSIYFSNGTGANRYNGYIEYMHPVNAMTFATAQTERMLITSEGNVGIGTSSPTNIASSYRSLCVNGSSAGFFEARVSNVSSGRFISDANNSGFGDIRTGIPIVLFTQDTERMRITSGGNVGINTTTPTSIAGYTILSVNNNTNSGVFEVMTNNVAQGRFFANPSNYVGLTAVSNIGLVFGTNDIERARFTNAGIFNVVSRGNFLNATDNALFSLNSGGTLYTVGFSPTATASSTNTLTLTTGTTTWIYTGTGVATWTLPNPSGNNQIYWIKNAGTGIITLNAYSGTNIINNSATSVSSITIAVGATAVIAQDGNVKSYQLQ